MKAHLIGVCGAGMSAVAHLLQQKGYEVSGSDSGFYPPVSDYVASLGIKTFEGYRAENIPDDVDMIVIGKNAKLVPESNEEVAHAFAAHYNNIRSFPEVVSEMCRRTDNIVVTGSYGKSTVTSIIAWVLRQAGKDPNYLIGALAKGFQHTSHLGDGRQFILEGDEYPSANWDDQSKFLHYRSSTVVLTAATHDHINIYPTIEDYHKPFATLLAKQTANGTLIACINEPHAAKFYDEYKGKKISYGLDNPEADWSAHNITYGRQSQFTVTHKVDGDMRDLVSVKTHLLGSHNIENLVAAAAVLLGQNMVTAGEFADAIASFEGITRRLDRKVPPGFRIHVYEGFGSSYEKARAAIEAMKLHFPDSRLIVMFEPHTFTWRNRNALSQYQTAFDDVDTVWTYHPPKQGELTHAQLSLTEIIAEARKNHADVRSFDAENVNDIYGDLSENDVLLILSSGNFDGLMKVVMDNFGV